MTNEKTQSSLIKRGWLALRNRIIANLLAGVLFVAPVAITVWFIKTIILFADNVAWPNFLKEQIPGAGILFATLMLLIIGALVRNVAGKRMQVMFEGWLGKVPFVRSIYFWTKQFLETVTASRERSFRRVVLIEYPRKGIYTMAFVTNEGEPLVEEHTGEKMLSLFVPTTPNPTSGYLIFVPEDNCTSLDIKIDDAFRLIISGGVLQAGGKTLNLTPQ